ncbi:MAG: hypothetical protein JWP58_1057 [Hymenobacter sp.]|nr:hypothetical protein [Hymenobacter sp.]
MAQTDPTDFNNQREFLLQCFEEFTQLQNENPAMAKALGFPGYVQYTTTVYHGFEQLEQLQGLADTMDKVRKALNTR